MDAPGGGECHVLVEEGVPGLAGCLDVPHTEPSFGDGTEAVQAASPFQGSRCDPFAKGLGLRPILPLWR